MSEIDEPTVSCDACYAVARVANDDWEDADDLRPLLPDGWVADDTLYVQDIMSWDGSSIETVVLCPRCQEATS